MFNVRVSLRQRYPGEARNVIAAVFASTADVKNVFVVDDDVQVRGAISAVLQDEGHAVAAFASCEAFLKAFLPEKDACLLIDAYLPGMSGLPLEPGVSTRW